MRIDPRQDKQIESASGTPERQAAHDLRINLKSAHRSAQESEELTHEASEKEKAVSVQWEQGQIMILRFTDKVTGNLIQQIPTEEVVKVFRAIQELLQEESSAKQIKTDL